MASTLVLNLYCNLNNNEISTKVKILLEKQNIVYHL